MGVLEGKSAIITGAGQGIAYGIAVALAKEGAKIMVAEFNPETQARAVADLRSLGATAIGYDCDISSREEVEAMIAKTADEFGGIDILINSAHSFGRKQRGAAPIATEMGIEVFDDDTWDNSIKTGLYGTFYTMRAAFPHLRDSGAGRVINFGSGFGVEGKLGTAAYNAAKEGIRGLSRTAANEWGQYGITVNVVLPAVASPAHEDWVRNHPEEAQAILDQIPMRRWGKAEEDAGRILVFYCSDDASYLTDQTIGIDGGASARSA